MIRVAICDDHQIVRAGFKQIFSSSDDFEVVAEAGTGREALDIARREICDVLLLDIAMPDQSGIDTLRTIRQGQPDLPVLILSGYPAQQYALNLFKMGANGYLNKECEADELITAVRTVYQGRRYVSSTVGELLAQSFDRDPNTALHTELSDREFQVFLRLRGATVSDIGVALSLSIKTVSTYRTRIMEKMGMQSNSDLTYYAMKNNLLGLARTVGVRTDALNFLPVYNLVFTLGRKWMYFTVETAPHHRLPLYKTVLCVTCALLLIVNGFSLFHNLQAMRGAQFCWPDCARGRSPAIPERAGAGCRKQHAQLFPVRPRCLPRPTRTALADSETNSRNWKNCWPIIRRS
jgi:DNA-binding NarL/FixJ family response regulator